MSRTKRIVIAAGIAVAVAATAGPAIAAQPTGSPAPFATPTTVAPGGGFVVPPEYVQLFDDTGLLTIAVPNTWTDVNTSPTVAEDRQSRPHITAAPDFDLYSRDLRHAGGSSTFAVVRPGSAGDRGCPGSVR